MCVFYRLYEHGEKHRIAYAKLLTLVAWVEGGYMGGGGRVKLSSKKGYNKKPQNIYKWSCLYTILCMYALKKKRKGKKQRCLVLSTDL